MTADPGSEVHLLDVPVDIYLRSEQHTSDMLREAVYVLAHGDAGAGSVYHRLLAASEAASLRGASSRTKSGEIVEGARLRGEASVELTMPGRPEVAELVERWTELLDEMDGECAAGRLLCLPADTEVIRFRHWFADQLTGQVRSGSAPEAFRHREMAGGQSSGS